MAAATQAEPQSCAMTPTPITPLASKPVTPFTSVPLAPQLAGAGAPAPASSMICTGSLAAVSPAMEMSASATGPQVWPPAKLTHSSIVRPCESVSELSVTAAAVRTDPTSLKPEEPVSSSTWSMFAHWPWLPETHTLTVT